MLRDRVEIVACLDRLKPAFRSGGAIPELAFVWFDGEWAYSYDGGLGIRVPFETDFALGVRGAVLLGMLGSSKAKQAELTEGDGAPELKLKMAKSRSTLAALPIERNLWQFPSKPPKDVPGIELTDQILEALRKLSVIKSANATRVEHHGVVCYPTIPGMDMYATDSATLARCRVKAATKGIAQFILPKPLAEQARKQLPAGAMLYVLPDCIMIESQDISLYCNLLDGDVLDLPGVVKELIKGNEPRGELPPQLFDALTRVLLVAGDEESYVELTSDGAEISLKAEFVLGTIAERMKCEGVEGKVQVRADMVQRMLADTDAMAFAKDNKALALYGEDDFFYLVAVKG